MHSRAHADWAGEQAGKGTRTRLTARRGHDHVHRRNDKTVAILARTAEAIQARYPAGQQGTTSGTDHGGSSYAQAASQSQPSLLLEARRP